MKLLYNDQKHYIYCDKGHISYNNSDTMNKKKYMKVQNCSFPQCPKKHCYLCRETYYQSGYHDCANTRRKRKNQTLGVVVNRIQNMGGIPNKK
mmetsp:Transcript_105288/g.128533  ORF Transcript_105288/g.128533 Transcript_105288/m.128533 type:complete len:93 (+) Transcript_105288:2-280(+)